METTFIFANGWGFYEGQLVYLPLWDPVPASKLGQTMMKIMMISQALPYVKNEKRAASLSKLALDYSKILAKDLGSIQAGDLISICPEPKFPKLKPRPWPLPWPWPQIFRWPFPDPIGPVSKDDIFLKSKYLPELGSINALMSLEKMAEITQDKSMMEILSI